MTKVLFFMTDYLYCDLYDEDIFFSRITNNRAINKFTCSKDRGTSKRVFKILVFRKMYLGFIHEGHLQLAFQNLYASQNEEAN